MTDPTISAVLIVKNEEVMLGRCLESLKDLDEIIVCDTGSTDKTIEIAQKYTDKIFTDFTWDDSFSRARNHAKSKATKDWILSIDADEFLFDVKELREAVRLAEQQGVLAVDTLQIAEGDGQKFFYPRLFKNSPQVYWEGNVHNTLSVTGEKIGDVRINVGYSPAHSNDPERAYRILKNEIDDAAKRHVPFSPRTMYYLGREYYYRGEWQNCTIAMGKYIQVSNFPAEKADAFLVMARAFWELKSPEDAKDAVLQAIKINPHFGEAADFMADLMRKDVSNPHSQANVDQWERMASTASNVDVLFHRKRDR